MTNARKAFLIWLVGMALVVIALTAIGLTCNDCQLPPIQ